MKLVFPHKKYYKSYLKAVKEWGDNGITTYDFSDASSCDIILKPCIIRSLV